MLAWRLAADVAAERALEPGRARTLAVGTGLTAAVYLPLLLHAVQPDSTILFGVLAVGACLLMTRVLRDPRGARLLDPRLLTMGLLVGAAALTRNEALWVAMVWAWLAIRRGGSPLPERLRLIGVVAVVSLLVFAPWAARDWIVFGNPLPGQAVSNALSVTGFDIFAWNDPPTLSRYLAVGPARLIEMRVEGLAHNVFNVLVFLGIPLSVIGILALPWQARDRALRPVVLVSALAFLVTSLLFPVATTWGTFLHAAAPVHVLIIVSALGALDAGLARLGGRMGWTRPIAWLGAVLAVGGSALFAVALVPILAARARDTARTFAVLAGEMAAIGAPLDGARPVIADFPIWLAETQRVPTLALPDEAPSDVLDLAEEFGARWLIMTNDDHGAWPAILDGGPILRRPASRRSSSRSLTTRRGRAVDGVRVFRIECPTGSIRRPDGYGAPALAVAAVTATLGTMDLPRSEPAGTRFDELHAEAAEALAFAANTLRAVRDRYRAPTWTTCPAGSRSRTTWARWSDGRRGGGSDHGDAGAATGGRGWRRGPPAAALPGEVVRTRSDLGDPRG